MNNISSTVSSNTSLLAEYVSYHFINGNFQNTSSGGAAGGGCSFIPVSQTQSAASALNTAAVLERLFGRQSNNASSGSFPQIYSGVYPNVTLGRTLLNSSDLVMLEGNKSQVLAWTKNDTAGNVTILNQVYVHISYSSPLLVYLHFYPNGHILKILIYFFRQNITVVNATTWQNLFINGIDGFLTPPGNFTTALVATNASIAQCLWTSASVTSANGTNETIVEAFQEARGITIFLPNNDAFTAEVNQTIGDIQSNQTALAILLQNHVGCVSPSLLTLV